MTLTENGDVIIHKETWDMMNNNKEYQELLEDIIDIELHRESMQEGGGISLDEYMKTRNIHVWSTLKAQSGKGIR